MSLVANRSQIEYQRLESRPQSLKGTYSIVLNQELQQVAKEHTTPFNDNLNYVMTFKILIAVIPGLM